ncbi:hypothetical protein [Hoeflea ulvae]|uniref:Transposase n=1 Tax=Hoeflea ulvae TaxID=2983764 RepID=A0ABT3YI43_9HYPH|nr:hypothetical protein [Hoeflea ulvae]MCY0095487.1 hypothetical protein [Hoeflea ulvae]
MIENFFAEFMRDTPSGLSALILGFLFEELSPAAVATADGRANINSRPHP